MVSLEPIPYCNITFYRSRITSREEKNGMAKPPLFSSSLVLLRPDPFPLFQ